MADLPALFDDEPSSSTSTLPALFDDEPKKLNFLDQISRPGAAVRSSIQAMFQPQEGERPGAAGNRGFMEGWNNPNNGRSITNVLPYAQTDNPFLNEAQHIARGTVGTIGDFATDPLTYVPLPVGKAIGKAVTALAKSGNPLFEGIAKWTAENLPNLAPNVSKAFNKSQGAANVGIQDILKKIEPQQPVAEQPNMFETMDGMQPSPAPTVVPDIFPTPQGQMASRDLLRGTKRNAPVSVPENQYESPIGPARDQGQQTFDFTKGPEVPVFRSTNEAAAQKNQLYREAYESATGTGGFKEPASVEKDLFGEPIVDKPNVIQEAVKQPVQGPIYDPLQDKLNFSKPSTQMQKEIDQIARTPNAARSKPYQGLSKQEISDLFMQREQYKPVIKTELPSVFDTAQPTMKPLKGNGEAIHMGDTYEMAATDADRIRREQLLLDRESVDSAPIGGDYGTVDEGALPEGGLPVPEGAPSAVEDLKTIIKNIRVKGVDPNIIEMHAGAKPPDFEIGPDGQEALDRWKQEHLPKIVADMKKTGKSMAESMKAAYPQLSAEEIASLTKVAKIGNLNLVQYPDEQKKQLKELFAGKEDELKTKPMTDKQITEKANELTSLPVTEMITRSGEGQTAAEIRRRVMTDIAKLKAVSEDTTLSSQEMVQKMLQLGTQQTKKVKTEIGRALGGMKTPLEAQEESLASIRKIVDRLRADPNLSSAESQALVANMRTQFPEMEKNATPAEIFKFMFRNFITSSPRTLMANATSGYANVAIRPLMRSLEVTSAKIRSLISQNPTSATYKEIGAMYQGMYNALKNGEKLPESLKAKTFSDKYNVSPLATKAATAKTAFGKGALDVTNKVVSLPENVMRRTDEHVKNVLGNMEKYAAKARGEDFLSDQHVIDRITSAQARGSFQDDMSAIGKWVAQSRNFFSKQEPTAFNQTMDMFTYAIQPFIQTVDRIIANGWKTSILGTPTTAVKAAAGQYKGAFAKGIMKDEVKGEKFDRDVAAAMIGVPLFVWAGSQLAAGNITGAAPQDSAGREAFGNSGKTEYSLKVKGRWIPFRDLPEPMSTALQINVAMIQGMTAAKDKSKDMMEGAFGLVQKVGNMLGTKQYLGGMNSLLGSLSNKGYDTVNELPLTKKLVPSLIPSAVKDVGVVKDTLQGKPRMMADTAIESLKRRAGMTDGMVPELNTFGEEVTHPMMGQDRGDAAHTLAEKFPPQPVERTREGVKLSQQEYYDLKKNVGQQRKQVYETLAKSDFFMKAPKGVQQTVVEEMLSRADEIGTQPQKIKELTKDPLYYDRALRILLEIDKPGGERHFPFLK